MSAGNERYDRNARFFGADGQQLISSTRAVICGLGGLGSHLAQQLAYLGVLSYVLVDADVVTVSSLNRLIGGRPADAEESAAKVDIAERTIRSIQPAAAIVALRRRLEEALDELDGADVVFGALDDEVARLHLTEATMTRGIAYFDLASDIDPEVPLYGGRVFLSIPGVRCLSCADVLDQNDLRRAALTPAQRQAYDRTYGIDRDALAEGGPSVISINGVVASLAVTEFIVWRTGLREPFPHLVWYAHEGRLGKVGNSLSPSCFYCRSGLVAAFARPANEVLAKNGGPR
jgi:molybdopterin-synthase adenylyltransferase